MLRNADAYHLTGPLVVYYERSGMCVCRNLFKELFVAPKEPSVRTMKMGGKELLFTLYLEEVYLVTAFVPSDTACFASSPGSRRRTAVWISRLVMVERLL